MRSKRFEKLADRPVNKETFILPWHEAGFINVGSPLDPKPSIKIENGVVTEMDHVASEDFDLIDPRQIVLDRILRGNNLAIRTIELVEGSVERCCLS